MKQRSKSLVPFFGTAAVLFSCISSAHAIGYTWIAGDGSWQVPQFWAPYVPPGVVGPPGLGDTALIAGDHDVNLSANALGLAGMVLQADADVFTAGHQLTVVNLDGTAQTVVLGTGVGGNNTQLFVTSAGLASPRFIGDLVDLTNGGEMDLSSNGAAHITNRLDVDGLSRITGNGSIVFTDTHDVSGRRLDLRGTIRPDSSGTITLTAESGTIDLDGQVNADNLIDLKQSDSQLIVEGPLHDSFTGRMEMGPGSIFTSSLPWELGPTAIGPPSLSLLLVEAGDDQATITGGEMTVGGLEGNISVQSGTLRLNADSRIQSNAELEIAAGAELDIAGSNSVITGGNWSGSGIVNIDADLTTIAADTVINMPNGIINLDGNIVNSGDTLAINQTLQIFANSIDDNPLSPGINDRVQINGAAGRLDMQLTNPFASYRFDNELDLNGPGGGLTGVHLVGSDVELAGETLVSGSSTTQAQIELTGDLDIATGGRFNLQGGSADNPNVVRATASVSGDGELRVMPGAQLNVEDGTSTGLQVINDGRFEPGLSLGTITMRSIDQGNSATLAFEINGPAGIGQDQITTTLASHVDGLLEVTVRDGFIPTLGQVYTLLQADSVSGTFDDFELLSDSIFSYEATVSYPGTRVALQFTDVEMLGDFNDDLSLGCDDVDALVAEIASGGGNLDFDMNGDPFVDIHDLYEWLDVAGTHNVGGSYLGGDANLDGVVDGLDFIEWNTNKFTATPAWCSGDFNADGIVDGLDFIIWNENSFMSSDAMMSVPEPATCLLWITLAIAIGVRHARWI